MNWEVSTMQSKRSSFNLTLFRKNLSRSWPLWGGLSLAGAIAPLYALLNLLNGYGRHIDPADFATLLYEAVTMFGPWFAAIYAILCAMVVWSYLDTPRAVGLMHTLPISRDALFLTNTLSGLTMMLIPYAVVGGALCVVAACFGFFHFFAVMQTVVSVLLLSLLFFGMATLCAMLTGNLFAMPALYLLLNVAAPLASWLVSLFSGAFLMGVPSDVSPAATALAPLFQLMESFREERERVVSGGDWYYVSHLEGLWVVALYGLVGLGLLALAWRLYKARHSERAGDVVAFRWMQPVFRLVLAFLSAFTLGWLLYALLWGKLFQSGDYADLLPMIGCTVLCGILGYFGASMLLEKSLRVFHKRGLLGALAVVALVAALNCAIRYDLFGAERKIPDLEDIKSVTLCCGGFDVNPTGEAGIDDELIGKILALHESIVAEAETIRGYPTWRSRIDHDWLWLDFEYRLTSGKFFSRRYNVPIPADWAENDMDYDDAVVDFFNDPLVLATQVKRPVGGKLEEVRVAGLETYNGGYADYQALDQGRGQMVYDALLRDAEAGNLRGYTPGQGEMDWKYTIRVELRFRVPEENGVIVGPDGEAAISHYDHYENIALAPTMTETIDALLATEAVTEEQLAKWQGEWERWLAAGGDPDKFPEVSAGMPVATELG